jgi:hypothetical protein
MDRLLIRGFPSIPRSNREAKRSKKKHHPEICRNLAKDSAGGARPLSHIQLVTITAIWASDQKRLPKFGAGWAKLVEPNPAAVSRRYAVSWKRQEIDLTELAISRWVEKLSMDALAEKFGVGRTFLVAQIKVVRENPDLVQNGPARKLVKLKERRFRGRG